MKNTLLKFVGIAAVSLLLAISAKAVDLNFNDGRSLGSIVPGVPDDDSVQVDLLNVLIDLTEQNNKVINVFNGPHDPYTFDRTGHYQPGTSLTDAVEEDGIRQTGGTSINLGTGFLYLMVKYGNGIPDASGNGFYAWYVGGMTGWVTVVGGDNVSHLSAYNPGGGRVPDGGTTAVLLGLSLVGLSFIAHRRMIA